MNKTLSTQNYTKLLNNITNEVEAGKKIIATVVDYQRVLTNWNVGRMIYTYLLKEKRTAQRGEKLYDQLQEDTGINRRVLRQTVQFFRYYPTVQKTKGLTWTHYTALLTISEPKERKRWEDKISREGINSSDFRLLLRAFNKKRLKPPVAEQGQLLVERGELYWYRVVKISYANQAPSELRLDCGFNIHIDRVMGKELNIPYVQNTNSIKAENGYEFRRPKKRGGRDLFTYVARVERVIDADTIIANIDCGFGIWISQRLRLKGIDAPELSTDAGLWAKKCVQKEMAECEFIIIKTYGSDKYDRYLVDVFFDPAMKDPHQVAAEGRYLNQMLLNDNLATIWKP